jgi:hypothetical protein
MRNIWKRRIEQMFKVVSWLIGAATILGWGMQVIS